jgi:hypothetical protein
MKSRSHKGQDDSKNTLRILTRCAVSLIAVLGILAPIDQASAASLSSFDRIVADLDAIGLCQGAQHIDNLGTDSVPAIKCSGATFSMVAAASTQFGQLHAFGDMNFNNFNPVVNQALIFETRATATFVDNLKFSQGAAIWEPTISISGTNSETRNNVGVSPSPPGWCFGITAGACQFNDFGTVTLQVQIPANQQLHISPTLDIDLFFQLSSNQVPLAQPLTQDHFVDISHTVSFLGSKVLDANGKVLTDATINSESGFNYVVGNAVPEPSTGLFLATAMFGLFALLRRNPKQRI